MKPDPRPPQTDSDRYARCVEVSKRVRWDIEQDLIRGRAFDHSKKFLPDGLSLVQELAFLDQDARRLLSQVQGRSYANLFALVERFINAKVLDVSRRHWLGDQTALEALVRFSDEELKHQAMFRRIGAMIAAGMPEGYRFIADANEVAATVLSRSSWSVLALTCHIELLTQAHYRESIAPDGEGSELFRDVFLFHWREESQHAILDELEWVHEHQGLDPTQRERGVDDLIALVAQLDAVLCLQADADAAYFCRLIAGSLSDGERRAVEVLILKAYRWQFILFGMQEPRFASLLASLVTPAQGKRIREALAPILEDVPEQQHH